MDNIDNIDNMDTTSTSYSDQSSSEQLAQSLKSTIIEYMLTNHNIEFISDDVERQLYDSILQLVIDILEPLILFSNE